MSHKLFEATRGYMSVLSKCKKDSFIIFSIVGDIIELR